MKSPHVSPEPLPNYLEEKPFSNISENSSSRSLKTGWTGKVAGHFMYKKKHSTLTKENLEVFNNDVEDKKYPISPYYKGLLFTEKVLGSSPDQVAVEGVVPLTHDLQKDQNLNSSSPYYKGLLFTEKVLGTSATHEAESASSLSNDLNAPSPYYKGLLNQLATSPDRESLAPTNVSSSSRTSFSVRMHGWSNACFPFRPKDEKPPSMIKVFSTENSYEKSLRERGSEPSSPRLSPELPTSPPPPLPRAPSLSPPKREVENAKDTSEPKEGKKFFWADKYRPTALKDFICNKDKALELQQIICAEDSSHFIFEGQAGVGKRTMIWAVLRDAFGPDKVQARDECKTFNLKGEEVSSIIVKVKESSQHVELNLSDLKGFEKHVIVELIKESNKLTNKSSGCNNDNCRAIILHEADKLSTDALLYIRWVIERYRGCHKIFFSCQDASKLQPLMTICKLVKLLSPSDSEIVEVLDFIAKKEEIELPRRLAEKIAVSSKNNLRQAIRSFEATWQLNSHLEEDQDILSGWEDDIVDIAKSIIEKQSPKQLYEIRRKLQNLIDHSVSPDFIFETLKHELMKNVDEPLHKQIEKTYKEYSGRDFKRFANDERKLLINQFMNIEEFIAKFMSCYKNHLAKEALDKTPSEQQ